MDCSNLVFCASMCPACSLMAFKVLTAAHTPKMPTMSRTSPNPQAVRSSQSFSTDTGGSSRIVMGCCAFGVFGLLAAFCSGLDAATSGLGDGDAAGALPLLASSLMCWVLLLGLSAVCRGSGGAHAGRGRGAAEPSVRH